MDKWIVGRGKGSDIVVNFPTVSRRHVIFREAGADIAMCDLTSTGGTYIIQDGSWTRVERASITPDEPIRLGDFKTTARALLGTAGVDIAGKGCNEHTTKSRHNSFN